MEWRVYSLQQPFRSMAGHSPPYLPFPVNRGFQGYRISVLKGIFTSF
ncbi:hypothetical protein EC990713_0787 [Escherichia coli 99.0713]|nr:hypothetical protein EC990713_0787 [Escherichia coli 99.0713]